MLLGNRQFRVSEGIWFFGFSNSWYVLFVTDGLNFSLTIPKLASNVSTYDCWENVPVSQVAGCRRTLLAGNSSISLAGSEEQINQQSPKMLIMISESFVHALLLCLGLFLKISRWVPLSFGFFWCRVDVLQS